jgi:hypothetical protein
MKKNIFPFLCLFLCIQLSNAQTRLTIKQGEYYSPSFSCNNVDLVKAPEDGLWSIATGWEKDWSADWHHASADSMVKENEWTILYGKLKTVNGDWVLRDAYRQEGNRIKCIRRYEWHGDEVLPKVTLSVRWVLPDYTDKIFMPGILYYGNPSGYRNCPTCVATFNKENASEALFEEHRFSMPFVCAEVPVGDKGFGVSLHTVPSLAPFANINDQWWSLGVSAKNNTTEMEILSGPIAMNGKRSFAKALQGKPLPYGDTWLNIKPKAVIEKVFYIEIHPLKQEGFAFKEAIQTSIDIFKPFFSEDMPSFREIIKTKYLFANTRWHEDDNSAGFCMYPLEWGPEYVMGWCGQAASLGYALQELAPIIENGMIPHQIQSSLDYLSGSPFNEKGFHLKYIVKENKWKAQDNVSQGQAMYNFAKAIESAKKTRSYDFSKWESFLKNACDIHADRILKDGWNPVSTNECFYIAPLCLASKNFNNKKYALAARKASDYYAKRHLSMKEPYWGGTLDASCEDKEGAWAAFQGFLAMYEFTKEQKYLDYATHAAYVTLSYTMIWDIPMPPSRLGNYGFKSRGWTVVSAQNQHLDVFGVFFTPDLYKLGKYLNDENIQRLALLMYRSCGQMIDPFGSHGEQIQHTNFAQDGDLTNIYNFRGGYVEHWTVFWVTAHFLNAAARFHEIDKNILDY